MPKRPQHAEDAPLALRFRARLADEQARQGMSDAGLAKRVTDLGVPMTAATIWKIKSGVPPRKVDLDEGQAIARAFNYEGVEDFLENREDSRLERVVYGFATDAHQLVVNAAGLAIRFQMYREALAGASAEAVGDSSAQVVLSLAEAESEVVPVLALLRRLADRSKRRRPGDEDELEARIGRYTDMAQALWSEPMARAMHPAYVTRRAAE